MTKRALIIGTSHSEASCRRRPGEPHELIQQPDRWHDNLSKYGYEVTNLSAAGCVAQQQFLAAWAYVKDNPDAYWDLVLIEGRFIDTAIAAPFSSFKNVPEDTTIDNLKEVYQFWEDSGDKKRKYWPVTRYDQTTLDNYLKLDTSFHHYLEEIQEIAKNIHPWYLEQVFSLQHAIDSWTVNYSLCNLLSRYATHVKWFTMSIPKEFTDIWETDPRITIGHDIIKDFVLEDTWPRLFLGFLTEDDLCDCSHLNEFGHQKLWSEIEKRLKMENIL